jgi:Iron-sulfur cluster-binding domain
MPWIHMHIWPNGTTYPCCMATVDTPLGQWPAQSMTEIWNGDNLRQLRQDMMAGRRNQYCNACYELEDVGMRSLRIHVNDTFKDHAWRIDTTADDGSVPQLHMAYLDIRFSNLCNLKCRSCGPDLSSSWHDDWVSLEGGSRKKFVNINHDGSFWQELLPYLDHTEEVYFAGGESLITDEHYRILQHWIDTNRTDVRIRYTTNFTTLNYKQQDLFALWRRFKDVQVAASLDCDRERGEYLRHGMHWPTIVSNRRRMLVECPDIGFSITPTVSLMNVLNLPRFHREWTEQGLMSIDGIRINLLLYPRYMSAKVLPSAVKLRASMCLEQHVSWLKQQGAWPSTIAAFDSILKFMNSEDDSDEIPQFLKWMASVDRLRKEDFFTVFPELTELRGA